MRLQSFAERYYKYIYCIFFQYINEVYKFRKGRKKENKRDTSSPTDEIESKTSRSLSESRTVLGPFSHIYCIFNVLKFFKLRFWLLRRLINWIKANLDMTEGGLIFKAGGSNMQHVTSLSFLLLAYSNYLSHSNKVVSCGGVSATPALLRQLAKRQVRIFLQYIHFSYLL